MATILHGALAGLLGAAAADFHAFMQWKTWNEASQFAWGVALIRWTAGGILGAASAAGFAAL